MATPVFLTIDTEFAWRHHAAGLDAEEIYERSLEPAGVGLSYQLAQLERHDLKACFFVDPMPALAYGLAPIARIVEAVLKAGQDVQLHCHPSWIGARAGDGGAGFGRFNLHEYSLAEQTNLLAGAVDLLVAAGAPHPVAFRAGSYAANDDTLAALAALGFLYDSSHNGAQPGGIGLSPNAIAPVERAVVEVPVTVIKDGPGTLRTFQVCALSKGESDSALDHAARNGHAAVTIVSHSFELANRAGTGANRVHVRRFEGLCETLAARREVLPTCHFADQPRLALGQADAPLGPDTMRTRWRQAEQLWSNWVAERAA